MMNNKCLRIVEPVEGWDAFYGRLALSVTRVVEPVEGWKEYLENGWGAEEQWVRDWFNTGESLPDCEDDLL